MSYQPLYAALEADISPTVHRQFRVALAQNFDTQDEALAAVQRTSRWKIAEAGEINPDERYNVDFRFRLDVSQLPRPFQIGAVGQADWNISVYRNQRLPTDGAR